jgi:outer membrane lipoprotein carrier protein
MVADGQTLWMHDVDLNQVTARRQAQVLASTPAAIIAAAADVRELEANFILKAAPDKDGLQWVTASPKATDGQLQSIRIGFRVSDKASELAVLEILDSFSQRSVLTFNKFETNPKLPADSFQFKPPAGADVIRQ